MATKTLLRSFAAGEITPELYGRIDLSKFQTGLALCENFRVLPHGPVTRRQGTRFVCETKDSTRRSRLIPFAFSSTQTYQLEFGQGYIRIHTQGGTVVENPRVVDSLNTAGLFTIPAHGWAIGDWVFISGMVAPTALNNTYFIVRSVPSPDTFTLVRPDNRLVNVLPTYQGGGLAARVANVGTPYLEADIFDLHYAQTADVLTIVHPNYPPMELRRTSATAFALTATSYNSTLPAPVITVVPTVVTGGATLTVQTYQVTTIAQNGIDESLPSAATAVQNNLGVVGNFNTITWPAVAGALRYRVYKKRGGVYGFIGTATDGGGFVDDNILADSTLTPPIYTTLFDSPGNYPAATTYHEQRRWWAGTFNAPQRVFNTRSGTYGNLSSSVPSQDDDAMVFDIASQQQNRVLHLAPLSDLLALTSSGEWRIFADGSAAITPTSLSVKPQGYSGASNVTPVFTAASVMYVQAQGSRVRELSYDTQSGAYASVDMAVMSPHLFNGHGVQDMAYTRAPDQTLHAVRTDGALLGLAYVPEQQVYGWFRYTTQGAYESVCCTPENNQDALYAIVRRIIGGRIVRFVERFGSRFFNGQSNAYFVDAGLSVTAPSPVMVVQGLDHLEGSAVSVLGDGADLGDLLVQDGQVVLPEAASVVQVGLPYASRMQTLPLAFEGAPAGGQGTMKNINKVHLRLNDSSRDLSIGPTFERTKMKVPAMREVADNYGMPPAFSAGEVSVDITPAWGTNGAVCILQDRPLPCTVLSMTLEVAVGG